MPPGHLRAGSQQRRVRDPDTRESGEISTSPPAPPAALVRVWGLKTTVLSARRPRRILKTAFLPIAPCQQRRSHSRGPDASPPCTSGIVGTLTIPKSGQCISRNPHCANALRRMLTAPPPDASIYWNPRRLTAFTRFGINAAFSRATSLAPSLRYMTAGTTVGDRAARQKRLERSRKRLLTVVGVTGTAP